MTRGVPQVSMEYTKGLAMVSQIPPAMFHGFKPVHLSLRNRPAPVSGAFVLAAHRNTVLAARQDSPIGAGGGKAFRDQGFPPAAVGSPLFADLAVPGQMDSCEKAGTP